MASSKSLAQKPEIPDQMLLRWQAIVDLMAVMAETPAGLVTQLHTGYVEVISASASEDNPYERGGRYDLGMNFFCKKTMAERSMVQVTNALHDPEWEGNPAIDQGIVSYLGLPLLWPNGDVFGTLCVLDSAPQEFSEKSGKLLGTLKELIESDLKSLAHSAAETELANAKFTTAFHRSPIPMVISTLDDGRLIEVNEAFEEAVGYSADEAVGRTAFDVGLWLDPDDRGLWVERLKKDGYVRDVELRFRTKSGEVIDCRTTTNVVVIDGERCLLTAVEDVSEQRRTEEALKESEKRYRSFVENFAGIAYQGRNFVPIFFHGDVKGITGYEERDFLAGKPKWNEIVHPDDLGVFETEEERKLHQPGGHAYVREYRIIRKDERTAWIQENIQGVCDENGEYQYVQGTMIDITERKQTEEALRRSEERLRTLVQTAPSVIVGLTPDHSIVEWNREAERVLGYCKEEVLGRDYLELFIPAEHRDRVTADIERLLSGAQTRGFEKPVKAKDGSERILLWNVAALEGAEGVAAEIVAIGQDITERKIAEAKLRESEEIFSTAFKMSPFSTVLAKLPTGPIVAVNPAFERITGYKAEEVVGHSAVELEMWSEEERERVLSKIREEKRVRDFVVDFHTKSGRPIICRCSAEVVDIGGEAHLLSFTEDITKREQMEEELKRTRSLLRAAIEQSAAGILIADAPDVRIRIANAAALGIRGESDAALIDIPVNLHPQNWQVFHPDGTPFKPENLPLSRAVLEGATVRDAEAIIRRAGEEDRRVLANAAPVRDADGKIIAGVVVFQDITKRSKAEKQLRAEKERAQLYLDIARTVLLALDAEGRIAMINREGCDLLGYAEEELLGKNWFDICLPEEIRETIREIFRLLTAGEIEPAEQYENQVVTKNGQRRLVRWHNTVVRNDQGRITGTLSSGEDITDRRNAEEALRASERKFRAVFDQSIQLTGLLDLDGIVLEANKASLQLAGIDAESVIGKPFPESPWWSDSPEEQEELLTAFRKAVAGEIAHVEVNYRDSKGRVKVFEGILSPLTGDSGEVIGVIPVGFDITELKEAEREVRESREQLRALATELSTAEEKERRRIASDLHDQLGQVLAVLQMKFGSLAAASDERESAQLIGEIRELLDQAIEDTATLTFDLSPPILYELGIEAAIEWAGETLCGEHDLSFRFSDDGRPKPMEEDAVPLLYRCARELILNVIKHADASNIEVQIERDGPMVSVAIEDDGTGFEPTESGEAIRSSAFGLYSIQERIHHLGGSFHIESKPGVGTRARVRAPIREDS